MSLSLSGFNPETLQNNELESTDIDYQNEKGFPKIIDIKEDFKTKDVYLKAFLLNDKVNKNFWNIPNDYIKKYATGFIGRPLIAHPTLDHPNYLKEGAVENSADYIEQALSIQNQYKAGEIVDVKEEDIKGQPGQKAWFAYIRMTNPDITSKIKSGSIPFYVSPQVYDTADVVKDTTTDFIPMHLAIVDQPAYGHHARIKAVCNGSGLQCTKALRSAASSLVDEIVNYTTESNNNNHHSSYVQNLDNSSYKLNPNEMNNMSQTGSSAGNGQLVSYQNKSESIGPNGEKIIKEEKQNVTGQNSNVTNPARVGVNTSSQEGQTQVGGSQPLAKESDQVQNNNPQRANAVNPDPSNNTNNGVNSSGSMVTGDTSAQQRSQIPTGDLHLPDEVMNALKTIPQMQNELNNLREFKQNYDADRQRKAGEEQLGMLQSFFTADVIADEAARNDLINWFAGLNLPNEALQKILEMIVNGGFKAASEEGGKKQEKKHQIKSASYQATAIMMNPYGLNGSVKKTGGLFGDDTNWDNIK